MDSFSIQLHLPFDESLVVLNFPTPLSMDIRYSLKLIVLNFLKLSQNIKTWFLQVKNIVKRSFDHFVSSLERLVHPIKK